MGIFCLLIILSAINLEMCLSMPITSVHSAVESASIYDTSSSLEIQGFSYSPFRRSGPIGGELASEIYIREDLTILKQLNVSHIRTYGIGLNQIKIPKIAHELGISCATGIWIGTDHAANLDEINVGLTVANVSSTLIIGNEVLFSESLNEEQLIDYILFAKNKTTIPIATAEPWYIWLDHPELADVTDQILIHIHPFWETLVFMNKSEALFQANFTIQRYNQIKNAFPEKEIIITETGWPSSGRGDCTEEYQYQYFDALLPLLSQNDIKCYVFEAFDEPWKNELWLRNPNFDVGPHWGVFNVNRTEKLCVQVFSEWFEGEGQTSATTTMSKTLTTSQNKSDPIKTEISGVTISFGFSIWVISVLAMLIFKRSNGCSK